MKNLRWYEKVGGEAYRRFDPQMLLPQGLGVTEHCFEINNPRHRVWRVVIYDRSYVINFFALQFKALGLRKSQDALDLALDACMKAGIK